MKTLMIFFSTLFIVGCGQQNAVEKIDRGVGFNIQAYDMKDGVRKSNNYWPDMPGEQMELL